MAVRLLNPGNLCVPRHQGWLWQWHIDEPGMQFDYFKIKYLLLRLRSRVPELSDPSMDKIKDKI